MLTEQMPSLKSSAETLFQLNADEQIRDTCDRFYRAEARERGMKNILRNRKGLFPKRMLNFSTPINHDKTLSSWQKKRPLTPIHPYFLTGNLICE